MTMKKISAVSVAKTVGALLLSGSRLSDAGKDRFKVRDGSVDFLVERYDDGRNNPYVITFTDFDLTSVFEFDTDGFVTVIGADEEIYNPVYETTSHKLRQVQRDDSGPHLPGRNSDGCADGTGEETASDYKINEKVNQDKRGYPNIRQPSDSDGGSAAPRVRESPALQTSKKDYSGRQPGNRAVKVGQDNSDTARDEYTLFEQQTAPFGGDIDADSDESRPSRMDQARVDGGEGDTVVDTTMPFSHVTTPTGDDADAVLGSQKPSSMRRSSVEGGGTDTDAGTATISRRMADAQSDTSSFSGKDLEERSPDVIRRGPDKCEDCQQTWDTLCDNGVNTVCRIVDDGQVVSAAIKESVHMLCVGFGMVCSDLSALDVCDGKCEEGQDPEEIEETEQDYEEEL